MANVSQFGVRRFGRVNWLGLWTLIRRENMRYLAIWQQTIFAPLITAALFLLVFSIAIGPGSIDQAHTADEFIEIEELRRGGRFFLEFLQALGRA